MALITFWKRALHIGPNKVDCLSLQNVILLLEHATLIQHEINITFKVYQAHAN